jgi:peptidoglycan/LPS O-acetylase OafA/YrhL
MTEATTSLTCADIHDLLIGISTAALIGLCNYLPSTFLARPAKFMSGYSYSLYAMHLPALVVFFSLDRHTATDSPYGAEDLYRFIAYFVCANVFCIVFWYAFERKTETVKRWMLRINARINYLMAGYS